MFSEHFISHETPHQGGAPGLLKFFMIKAVERPEQTVLFSPLLKITQL
jgi:hypothetical protein